MAVCRVAVPEFSLVCTKKYLSTHLNAGLFAELCKMFKRTLVTVLPSEECCGLVVCLIAVRPQLRGLFAQSYRICARNRIRSCSLHIDTTQIQIGCDQPWTVAYSVRECLLGEIRTPLLDFHDSE